MPSSRPDPKKIFLDAIEKPRNEWESFVAAACGSNLDVRERVWNLLQSHLKPAGILAEAAFHPFDGQDDDLEVLGGTIGPYKLLEKIGEGGMGVVYRAEQQSPVQRMVALKIIKPGMDSKHVIARFEAERQALALMEHPNIARVFDAGTTPSHRHYFVMELVHGIPITDHCERHELNTRARLQLFIDTCNAIQHAHQKGIIHRDIKPSNAMVAHHDGAPVVKVIDFGVAKALNRELTERTLFTSFSQVIGTPMYMSPEQTESSGVDVDTRSDVYSLGVLLYELLTGSTPFDEETFRKASYDEMRRIIQEKEPPTPSARISTFESDQTPHVSIRRGNSRQLSQMLRGELDWIVMKALAKDRSRRYETASSLARDIERYLKNEPVEAGPPSATYRIRKIVRKHRQILSVAATIAILLCLSAGAVLWQASLAYRAEVERDVTSAAFEREQRLFYFNRIVLADRERLANNVARARQLLNECPEHLREWEWHYLDGACQQELFSLDNQAPVSTMSYSPDGRLIATGGFDHSIRIWDAMAREVVHKLDGHTLPISGLTFTPDGKHLVSSGNGYEPGLAGEIKIWDVQSGIETAQVDGVDHGVFCCAVSPDGRHLAYLTAEYLAPTQITIWDLLTSKRIRTWEVHAGPIPCVVFSPDGQSLLSAGSMHPTLSLSSPGEFRVWNVATAEEKLRVASPFGPIWTADYSADGQSIVTSGGDRAIRMWNATTGERQSKLSGHTHAVTSVKFASPGLLASASLDSSIMLWMPRDEQAIATFRGHVDSVTSLTIDRKRNHIASGSEDGTVKVWDITDEEALVFRGHRSEVGGVALSADGLLASNSRDGVLRIWDAISGLQIYASEPGSVQFGPHNLDFTQDGKRLAVSRNNTVWILEARTGRNIQACDSQHPAGVTALDISPDGKYVASISSGPRLNERGEIRIWEFDSGKLVRRFAGHPKLYNKIGCIKYSSDGERLVTASGDNTARIWDAHTGEQIGKLEANSAPILGVAIRSDDRYIAVASDDNSVRLWEVENDRLRTLPGHTQDVISVEFSPDGTRLVSGANDNTVKVWDVESGEEVLTLRGHMGAVRGVAFSPDGRRVAAGSADTQIRIWSANPITDDLRDRRHAARIVNELNVRSVGLKNVSEAIERNARIDDRTRRYAIEMASQSQERVVPAEQ